MKDISTHSLTKRLTRLLTTFRDAAKISTHSLTKRLTIIGHCFSPPYLYFNSQPHEEADVLDDFPFLVFFYFNSQPHEEADHRLLERGHCNAYFNSQPHEEADLFYPMPLPKQFDFNSQPHEEADLVTCSSDGSSIPFQLTASRRGWRSPRVETIILSVFQLTASRRGWREALPTVPPFPTHFNSQPHEEADFWCHPPICAFQSFQLTASRRGWL